MEANVTRRGFLRTTFVSAAVIFMMSFASWSSALDLAEGMIPIVMATDSLCLIEGQGRMPDSVVQWRVQHMVDASVAELTGIIDSMPLAYEVLFPYGGITDTTIILIKYNPLTPETSRKPMVDALKNGLTYMLNHTFPEENIIVVGDEGTADTEEKIVIDSGANAKEYIIKDLYVDADWIIYCPSAWATDIGCGVDMSMKLMLDAVEGTGGATMEDLYTYLFDTSFAALSILNHHPVFKDKQVLYLMDLITYSGTGSPDDVEPGYRIYATTNVVVSDWKGVRFLKDSAAVLSEELELAALKICTLACAPYVWDLGVTNEGQMYEIPISPPWVTAIAPVDKKIYLKDIQVKTNPAHTTFSYPRDAGSHAIVSIYDIHGREIWSRRSSEKSIVWNKNDRHGHKVPSGVYLYQLKVGKIKAQGKTTIKR